jgi:PAS domain S-box-containing protein
MTGGLRVLGRRQEARILDPDSDAAYRGIFEHAIWGMFQTTPDGRYLRANAALARIYGYESAEALLRTLTNISRQLYVNPDRRAEFVRLMQENGKITGFESLVYRRDGSVIWISESCRAVHHENGALICYEGTVEDITARKHAEADLLAAREQAEQSSQAKSIFLANMSHELRTPLNAVLGFSEIMEQELFGPLGDERYKEFARDIYRSGKHLLDIIGDILDLTKVEAGQLVLDHEDVAIGELLRDCGRLVADQARNAEVHLEIQAGLQATIRGDETRLRQIILNLLSNAIKFTPGGNAVVLSARIDDAGCAIEVADQGIGMTSDEVQRALQPFQQIDNSFSRRYEGTGLGLPLTKSLVELHGGELVIESEPGVGTIITVRLPNWQRAEQVAA